MSSPLKRRDALQVEIVEVRSRRTKNRERVDELREEHGPNGWQAGNAYKRRLDEARISAARGEDGAEAEVSRLQEALAAHRVEVAELLARNEAANQAVRQAEAELEALYREEFEVFAEEAEQATETASEALAALREQYVEALARWQEASDKWRPICAANRLTRVPGCPLPPVTCLNQPARPPQVSVG